MLNPQHLRTLVTVVRTGSFAAAARHLGYTGSAVSQQISALERAVKMPLFERSAQSIRPTPVAEFLVGRAQEVLTALGTLDEDIRGLADGSIGRLRLGSFPTASERLIPPALAQYVQSHPAVAVELDEGEPDELVQRLQVGELDLALVYRYDLVPHPWPHGLRSTRLMDEDLILLLPSDHRLAQVDEIRLEQLENDTWVTSQESMAGAACLRRSCASAGFAPRIGFRSNDYDVVREFVRSRLGIALIPALAHVAIRDIAARRVLGLSARRHVLTLHRADQMNPAIIGAVAVLRTIADRTSVELAGDPSLRRPSNAGADDEDRAHPGSG